MFQANWGLRLLLEEPSPLDKQETRMINSAIRFVTLAMFLAALGGTPPVIPALAAGGGGGGGGGGGDPYVSPYTSTAPTSPHPKVTRTTQKGKKKPDKQSSIDDPAFAQGYRAA